MYSINVMRWKYLCSNFEKLMVVRNPLRRIERKNTVDNVKHSHSYSYVGSTRNVFRDQYTELAEVYDYIVGDKTSRTTVYRNFLLGLLRSKGCHRILDVACGTGIDSVMLVEQGFEVVSVDASDKMLKHDFRERRKRRNEPGFDRWIIDEANWLTLFDDVKHSINGGFDAVICLGNSFPHLLDSFGDQREQKSAIENFRRCIRSGGILIIDHRNYDDILRTSSVPSKNIYYNSKNLTDIKTTISYDGDKPSCVISDYFLRVNNEDIDYRFTFYPHKLDVFSQMLSECFGSDKKHSIFGDYKPLNRISDAIFYLHVIEK